LLMRMKDFFFSPSLLNTEVGSSHSWIKLEIHRLFSPHRLGVDEFFPVFFSAAVVRDFFGGSRSPRYLLASDSLFPWLRKTAVFLGCRRYSPPRVKHVLSFSFSFILLAISGSPASQQRSGFLEPPPTLFCWFFREITRDGDSIGQGQPSPLNRQSSPFFAPPSPHAFCTDRFFPVGGWGKASYKAEIPFSSTTSFSQSPWRYAVRHSFSLGEGFRRASPDGTFFPVLWSPPFPLLTPSPVTDFLYFPCRG